jgi:hypothetical protein
MHTLPTNARWPIRCEKKKKKGESSKLSEKKKKEKEKKNRTGTLQATASRRVASTWMVP